MTRILYPFLCICLLLSISVSGQPFKRKWIDSVYSSLTETQRVGQLFMVAAYSGGPKANQDHIERLLKARQIGGIIFMQGTAEDQARLTNLYQQKSKVQLLIAMDAEWGLGMRLTGVRNFPRQMSIGATRDTALMYEMGAAIALQCKRLGVHIDFAPVVDINNNPANPVINFRSFGDNKEWVSDLGIAYMKGLQDNGIMACAKHFPGHGDVAVDSHLDLPVINKSKSSLNEMEFYPFRKLIEAGVQSVMIAHLSVPALDPVKNRPTTLSYPVVTDLLKKELGFKGLVFTDALDMKGLTNHFPDGETDLLAYLAGNDVLLFSQNVPLAIQKIQWAIKTGKSSEEELERRVKKILAAKYDAGLWQYKPVKEEQATEDLNQEVNRIREKVARSAVTLVKDQAALIKKIKDGKGTYAYVNINGKPSPPLQAGLKKQFSSLNTVDLPSKSSATVAKLIPEQLGKYDAVIVGIHDLALYPGKNGAYGLDSIQISVIKQLASKKNVIFAVLGNAYLLRHICNAKGVIVAYEDDIYAEEAVLEVLLGKLKAKGQLPVKACK